MAGRDSGACSTGVAAPAALTRGPGGKSAAANGTRRRRARSFGSSRSATTTMRAGRRLRASCTHSSGPMPAGSPAVTAISGVLSVECLMLSALVEAVFDESQIAPLAHPLLVGLVGLARAQGAARLQPQSLLRHVLVAPFQHLDQVPSERCLHGAADLPGLKRVHGALELGHDVARGEPSQLAALGVAAVLRELARELGEIGLVLEALLDAFQAPACLGLGHQLVGADEDVAGAGLADDHRRGAAAALVEHQDMEAVG